MAMATADGAGALRRLDATFFATAFFAGFFFAATFFFAAGLPTGFFFAFFAADFLAGVFLPAPFVRFAIPDLHSGSRRQMITPHGANPVPASSSGNGPPVAQSSNSME